MSTQIKPGDTVLYQPVDYAIPPVEVTVSQVHENGSIAIEVEGLSEDLRKQVPSTYWFSIVPRKFQNGRVVHPTHSYLTLDQKGKAKAQ